LRSRSGVHRISSVLPFIRNRESFEPLPSREHLRR
jgi:hypothetical protein